MFDVSNVKDNYDPSVRPIWTHGADGKPNRKIWIPRTDFGAPGAHLMPPPDIAMQLRRYAAQNRILRRFARASTESLERFAAILESVSDRDIEQMGRFAEALADWPDPDVSSE